MHLARKSRQVKSVVKSIHGLVNLINHIIAQFPMQSIKSIKCHSSLHQSTPKQLLPHYLTHYQIFEFYQTWLNPHPLSLSPFIRSLPPPLLLSTRNHLLLLPLAFLRPPAATSHHRHRPSSLANATIPSSFGKALNLPSSHFRGHLALGKAGSTSPSLSLSRSL